jgi:uncharacterized repeat protein (TIGR01451 family)
MNSARFLLFAALLVVSGYATGAAESHRATRLGNPDTRFAPPLRTPEDLRLLFSKDRYKADIASILRQWGWQGKLEDLHRAAATAAIEDIKIAIGTTMPFMSSRENYEPICLRNVLWAGEEPAPAYAFRFSSNGRRYRCVTPKACSNFFVEDLGPEPKSVLTLECSAPGEILAGRPVQVCLTVRQTGDTTEANATLTLSIPEGATVTSTTEGGVVSERRVSWELRNLAPNSSNQVCAVFATGKLGPLSFASTARGSLAPPVEANCGTKVIGVPAILLEVVDLEDPIEIGKEVTYEIKVINQGTATATNVRLVCTVPESQEFVSGGGSSEVTSAERTLTLGGLGTLEPKGVASWRIIVKPSKADDARFKVELTSDQFQRPIVEAEATQQY